jgi:hypothetical protein
MSRTEGVGIKRCPRRWESKDDAALEFGEDQFNEASSVFRPCFDPGKKATV